MKQASTLRTGAGKSHGLSSKTWLLKNLVSDGAADWGLSPQVFLVLLSLPFVIAFTGVVAALISKDLYKLFTQEDGIAESGQVFFYALALGLSLFVTRSYWRSGARLIACLYIGASLGLFFLIGEELSWGQRIWGWGTAESLAAVNKQGETNLHNIYGVGATFKWVQLLIGAYGTLLPLVFLRWSVPDRHRLRRLITALVPHYSLIPYFLLFFIWRMYRNFLEPPQKYYFAIAEYNEVLELVLAMGFLLFMVFQIKRLKAGEVTSFSTTKSEKTGDG